MTDGPRENRRMLDNVETSYETALYMGDDGLWTIIEIVKRPILKAPSEQAAHRIITRLKQTRPSN